MSDPHIKLNSFGKALNALGNGLQQYDEANDLARDGIIHRFEFTFELAWKSVQAYCDDEGIQGVNSPKGALREAFAAGLIDDEALWLAMLRDRNSTAHLYSEELAMEILQHIQSNYFAALSKLHAGLAERINRGQT